jgi:hypothetical protein
MGVAVAVKGRGCSTFGAGLNMQCLYVRSDG